MKNLYGELENSINNVRSKVFRKGLLAPELLPPPQYALYLHLKLGNKVAYEWKTALDQHQSPLNPEEHGWETDGNRNIKIKWTTKAPGIIQYSKILQILEFFLFSLITLFFFLCEQLESGLSPQSCLYFRGFWGSQLLNGCFVVLPDNQFAIRGLVACKLVAYKKLGVYREKKVIVNILKLFSNNKVKLLQLRKNKPRKKFFKKANKTELL